MENRGDDCTGAGIKKSVRVVDRGARLRTNFEGREDDGGRRRDLHSGFNRCMIT